MSKNVCILYMIITRELNDETFRFTLVTLIATSVLTGIRSLSVYDHSIETQKKIKSLQIAMMVNIIASIHYYWMLDTRMGVYRYLDWYITTPLLLWDYSIITGTEQHLFHYIWLDIAMLTIGIFGELGTLSRYTAGVLGFIPFVALAWLLKKAPLEYEKLTNSFILVWALYGVNFFIQDNATRNLFFNILDSISKSGFALYIFERSFQ